MGQIANRMLIEVIFKAKEKLKEKKKNDDCISDGSGHIKCNGYAGLCVDAKLWYVHAVVLARLCVRHGNWNIAMNSQRIE